ncbi:unnamed protein product [Lactuca saligna]|uniref:Uncharacterized protein n=1 Tax=Lactuca saligna TaxID=75948 RepID=A0AA36EBR2_LACSI|nr:unnamed protein product [Lactuca saligna]
MTAKESSIWLSVLSREEALILQSSGDNGGSGITGTPSGGGRPEKTRPENSYDSDYDVDGVENGGGSVSSKDDRRRDTPEAAAVPLAAPPRKKRKREKSKVDQVERDGVPDINEMDVSLIEYPVLPENHPLMTDAVAGVETPANMVLYPPPPPPPPVVVQDSDYRPQSLVDYRLFVPVIEGRNPVNEFQMRPEYSSEPPGNVNPIVITGGGSGGGGGGVEIVEKEGYNEGQILIFCLMMTSYSISELKFSKLYDE